MTNLYSVGIGVGSQNSKGEWLEVFYPAPVLAPSAGIQSALSQIIGEVKEDAAVILDASMITKLADAFTQAGESLQAELTGKLAASSKPVVAVALVSDSEATSVPAAYLKLHLISHRLVKPHGTNLSGIFGVLPNVAWTNEGAIDLTELPQRQLEARMQGCSLQVSCVDKFPKMTDYVVPGGVRIADTSRVRLGAYIGEGTTIMHEGFVNFNAGAEGPNMIEGRISAGVFIGAGSDLGGSSSTMGTLSGGGNIVISVGKECLLGANAGIGIPLGDRCTVEAGLYITAGTKVLMLDDQLNKVGKTKARELAGRTDLLFRRNSMTGAVECLTNQTAIELNEALHAHN
ncbi:MAG: 2,3,4,5-tetrahydropyridine-2,6-dicarboxylate N-succinyltransferase [Gammaproteobacteria bacterium]|nr:MAG: 2,3,4,5-tetrahydropyridine-2,6-dicarboxylate N-succinyltransferase [Gammaproteobacteria bacterium]RLA54664.1 MAG: 2,3,4,5-tetrahydropyridine-2,6-dicarboxylate N-succinyltransferase [Gammaproteobacteria bacterium]